MSWSNIQVDDYGWKGKLTLTQDGSAVDLSSYTTKQFIISDPSGNDTTVTAEFTTDGTDGVLEYTVTDGLIDEAGIWKVRARVARADVELTSQPLSFVVEERE